MERKPLAAILILITSLASASLSSSVKAQTAYNSTLDKFISRNFRLPDSLKSHCEWMYAIVKLQTNNSNKVTGIKVVNPTYNGIKNALNFLQGYQLPKGIKANGRSVVFYLAIDNLNGCDEKPGEKVFYAPNDAGSTIWNNVAAVLRDDPRAIILPGVIIYGYSKPQP